MEYLDAEELPPVLVDLLEKSQVSGLLFTGVNGKLSVLVQLVGF